MKKIFLGLGLLATSIVSAQFKINGKIEDYANQQMIAKIHQGIGTKIVDKVTTNAKGEFTVNIPFKYNGIVELALNNGEVIKILSDNQTVSLKGENSSPIQNSLQIKQGDTAKQYAERSKNAIYLGFKDTVFSELIKFYQPNEPFHEALKKEMQRIDQLENATKNNAPLVTYISNLETLTETTTNGFNESDLNSILEVLKNDDERLEQSGLMNTLIFNYVKAYFGQPQNKGVDINEAIRPIITKLVSNTNIATSRGQNVLASVINILTPKQFPSLNAEYLTLAKSIKGEVSEDLKLAILNVEGLKQGEKVPNFTFDKKLNGKSSLFDVKADKKLIVFWASWCPACMNEMPLIEEYYSKFKAEGGEIVAVSLDYDQAAFDAATKNFLWYNTTELLRWDSEIAKQFGVNSTPTLFLVDKDDKLIKKVHHISDL